MNFSTRPRILLVEDNLADRDLVLLTLEEFQIRVEIDRVHDGEEALDFLKRRGAFTQAKRPQLVLLDLNLPKMDGREVLAAMKEDADLRRIPVIVLSSSASEDDIRKCYDAGANCYMTKGRGLDELQSKLEQIVEFWLTMVQLPYE